MIVKNPLELADAPLDLIKNLRMAMRFVYASTALLIGLLSIVFIRVGTVTILVAPAAILLTSIHHGVVLILRLKPRLDAQPRNYVLTTTASLVITAILATFVTASWVFIVWVTAVNTFDGLLVAQAVLFGLETAVLWTAFGLSVDCRRSRQRTERMNPESVTPTESEVAAYRTISQMLLRLTMASTGLSLATFAFSLADLGQHSLFVVPAFSGLILLHNAVTLILRGRFSRRLRRGAVRPSRGTLAVRGPNAPFVFTSFWNIITLALLACGLILAFGIAVAFTVFFWSGPNGDLVVELMASRVIAVLQIICAFVEIFLLWALFGVSVKARGLEGKIVRHATRTFEVSKRRQSAACERTLVQEEGSQAEARGSLKYLPEV